MPGDAKDFEPDYSWYDPSNNDEEKIRGKTGPPRVPKKIVPCRICQEQFGRVTLTFVYCATCKHAFCEGVHGSFSVIAQRTPGKCVICHLGKDWNSLRRS